MRTRVLPGPESSLLFAAAFTFLFVQWNENVKVRHLDIPWVEAPETASERWNPLLVRMVGLEQKPVLTDWTWLRMLMDSELSHVSKGIHPVMYYDVMLGTELDPLFYEAYTVGANLLTVIRDDNVGALELAERGLDVFHNVVPGLGPKFSGRFWYPPWELPMVIAYIRLFEVGDLPGAAAAFTEASKMAGSPPYLQHLVGRLATRAGQFDVGEKLLKFMLENANAASTGERTQEVLTRKVRNFTLSKFLFEVNEGYAQFLINAKKGRHATGASPDSKTFAAYMETSGLHSRDPEGGELKLSDKGRIITTTPHVTVLGMGE